ncbi:MerR family transcriptional regulator [Saccharopolyspora antimicrobica]|uniref:MerR family transcriptional regulator n=1 Tax=Saccharopolyspora antimicrobica TaxID=455193 RepID=UPI000B891028|nr:MerR family transcriptional regulator [Saccharopolyspora antimicrobica]
MGEATVQIGELAARTGVSRRSLRYYEQRGLLHSRRTEVGWREYDEDVEVRVRNVHELLSAGLTVEDVRRVEPCLDQADHFPCDGVDEALEIHEARLAVLDERLARIQEHRDRLARRVERLREQREAQR